MDSFILPPRHVGPMAGIEEGSSVGRRLRVDVGGGGGGGRRGGTAVPGPEGERIVLNQSSVNHD